jgi:3-oxoacyl-[acyl-carrier-protein] synthase II
MSKKVVVTGMGVVSAIGCGIDNFWQGLMEGRNGIDRVTRFEIDEFPSHMDAEIKDFSTDGVIDKKEAKRMDLFVQYAIVAAHEAAKDAALDMEKIDPNRVGVILGSGIGGIQTSETQYQILRKEVRRRFRHFLFQ